MVGRRRALALGALVATGALGLAAGCSSASPEVPQDSDSGTALLTIEVYGPAQVVTAYAKIASDFTDAHPNTVVNVRPYSSASAAVDAVEGQVGTSAEPDAFLAPVTAVPELMAKKAITPVDELLGERQVDFGDGYQRSALEAFSLDKRLQCMPVDDSPLVVYYNKDLVDLDTLDSSGGDPADPTNGWTLDQFAAAAKQAAGRTDRGVYVEPSLDQLAPFIWSGGGKLVDNDLDPTTLRLSDGGSRSALEKLLEIVRNPSLTFSQEQLESSSALERFKAGTLGMILGYRSLTPELRAQAGLNFDVMPLPRIGGKATVGQTSGLCLSSTAVNQARTADFLAYAVSDEAQALVARTGYSVPTNLDVVNSEDFVQTGRQPATSSVFGLNVRYIRPLPDVTGWEAVEAEASPLLTALFYDPVIDPLDDRLNTIDAGSVPLFAPAATPSP
ncbi:MAG: ABC transporter substrate-binding protein [Marmoricola sp.]